MTMTQTYAQLVKTITDFPKCHLATNIASIGVDLEVLKKHPILADYAQSILSGKEDKNIQGWDYFYRAYFDLEAKGLLTISNTRDAELQAFSAMLEAKASGPCLIPKAKLKDTVIKTTKKKVVSYSIDYNEFVDLIEHYYGIEHRGLFERDSLHVSMATDLGLTVAAFQEACRVSPYDSFDAARIAVLTRCREQVNAMPYVDIWHYHMETQCPEVENGAVHYFSFDDDVEMRVQYVKRHITQKDQTLIDPRLFLWFDQIMVKELGQLPMYKGTTPEEVAFFIS